MATHGHRINYSGGDYVPGLLDLRPGTDCEKRNAPESDLEEETMGVEHGLDGPRIIAGDVVHDHAGHEAAIWKAATRSPLEMPT